MRALEFDGALRFAERPRQALPGECLVRVRLAGICNTDLEITAGYMGFRGVLGHEFVGEVEAGSRELIGKRVVGEINVGCGECDFCRRDLSRHCPRRTVLGILGRDGAFAEALSLPAANLHVVPDHVTDGQAVFVEPLAAACEILEQLRFTPEMRVGVIGDGKLAILIARVLATIGVKLTAVGHHADKLRLMPAARAVLERDFTPAHAFDVVIEASGQPNGWRLALAAVRPHGTIVLKSTYAGGLNFNPAPLVVDEITVIGSRCGPFPAALRLLASGAVPVDDLVTATVPFADAPAAFELARRPDALKVLLTLG
jgi:2-desacetyl-2-hydroxyethyl bacteriochlorophyllide A dehydrogenase